LVWKRAAHANVIVLDDQVICTTVASYLVWFERKLKHEQDNILLQWMIYGRTPRGRHSLSSSQDKPHKFGYYMPFDGLCLDVDGDSLKKICFCALGLQFVMGTGRQQMKAIRETAKTTAMIPSSHSHDASQAMHK
jgi:hypothetical protein